MIWKMIQIFGSQPWISKVFLDHYRIFFSRSLEQFFFTVGQNNFDNKIPLFTHWRAWNLFFSFFKLGSDLCGYCTMLDFLMLAKNHLTFMYMFWRSVNFIVSLWNYPLSQNTHEIISRFSALAPKKWLNQKLYYTNYVK